MSLIAGSIKSILAVKLKTRHDSYTDQVSRIFVAKMFIVASLVLGVDWFQDTVQCITPSTITELKSKFVHSACWIQGFYVYPEMENYMKQSGYYGIPEAIEVDGILNGTKHLCGTKMKLIMFPTKKCVPMERYYFTQYQWMPFCVASLAMLFYAPYIIFRLVNADMISLRLNIRHIQVNANDIVHSYFDHGINSILKMRLRILANFIIKCLYIIVNVVTFYLLNVLLNNEFEGYGINWTKWARLPTSLAMDFRKRLEPSPGNKMLPTFGFCDIHEAFMDSKTSFGNKNKLICEISSNILYQYVFLVLWFVLVFSITVSCLGLILNIFAHLINVTCFVKNDKSSKAVYKYLTFRECEYLEFIRRKNLYLFSAVVRRLHALKIVKETDVESGLASVLTMESEAENAEADNYNYASHMMRLRSVDCGKKNEKPAAYYK